MWCNITHISFPFLFLVLEKRWLWQWGKYNDTKSLDLLNNIKTIVAHNILFDINIILSEAYRCNNNTLIDNIRSKELECSMKCIDW